MKLCPKCQKQFPDDANFCPVDAARLVPFEARPAGTDSLAARYELGAKLGGTETGAVYRASDKSTGAAVAIKLVAPAVAALPGVAQRLDRELQQLARVQSSGIAKILGSGKRPANGGEETWIAMELVDGAHTLAEAITARGPIPAAQAADLVQVIGEALIEAAQVGVVHRDLAPKNVLFAGGDVKLVNFALPVPAPSGKTFGVTEFVAPEQIEGRPVDQRSNLYSLGAIYYYALTGQHASDNVVGQTVRPPSQLAPSVAAGSPIENVILRALERSPTKRFLTVRQFLDEVGRVGRGEVIELNKPIAPASRRQLVSTLMGISKTGDRADDLSQVVKGALAASGSGPVTVPTMPSIASAPTVGSGVPSVVPSVIVSSPSAPTMLPQTSTSPAAILGQTKIGIPAQSEPIAAAAAAQPTQAEPARPAVLVTPTPATPTPAAPVVAAAASAAAEPMPVPRAPEPPVVAAPIVAAPVVPASGGKKESERRGGEKGKFRETMWFKKGDLDTQAAIAAADERARTGKDVANDKADSLPVEDRYKDDGSITRSDKEKYSLRTGGTQLMKAVRPDAGASANKVDERELIGEMRGNRTIIVVAIVIVAIAAAAIIFLLAR